VKPRTREGRAVLRGRRPKPCKRRLGRHGRVGLGWLYTEPGRNSSLLIFPKSRPRYNLDLERLGRCCGARYFCPTADEYECAAHGGFTVCCSAPELHRKEWSE
jgi:hypothetical protein